MVRGVGFWIGFGGLGTLTWHKAAFLLSLQGSQS